MDLPDNPEELARVIRQLSARVAERPQWEHLEELFTSRHFFGVPASPLQRAICRIADGRPLDDLDGHPDVVEGLKGGGVPDGAPFEVAVLSAIRAGKSLLAAAASLHASQIADVSQCSPGDLPRAAYVSVALDQAQACFGHLVGNMLAKPDLKSLLIGDPSDSAGTALIRHPSGRPIEVKMTAGARGGKSLVSRWLVIVIFDEFALMSGEGDAAINWGEQRKAVRNRILPGGSIWHIGSPWAPVGPAYEMCRDHHGKPTKKLIVIRAPGWSMNPSWWTPERVAQAHEDDADAAAMTVDAKFGDPPTKMFAHGLIEAATRKELVLPPVPGASYSAAMDPATRGNGWTLVVSTRGEDAPLPEGQAWERRYTDRSRERIRVALAHQWKGSKAKPLDAEVVFDEMAALLKPYGVTRVETDQYASDVLVSMARRHGLEVIARMGDTGAYFYERCKLFLDRLEAHTIELPPVDLLGSDLRLVDKFVTNKGFRVNLPSTGDGRHCDYVPALMLSTEPWLRAIKGELAPPGSPEADKAEADRMREARTKKPSRAVPWWKKTAA